MDVQLFLYGLFIVSTLTGLTTEAIKKIATGKPENLIACFSSIIISLSVGTGYLLYNGIAFTIQPVILLIALAFMSWLSAMCGYDKLMQTITQIKKGSK